MFKQITSLKIAWLTVPFALTFLAGCQNNPSKVEDNFGSSVRNAIALQTAQPGQTTTSMDGQKGEVVLETYRKDAAILEKVDKPLQVNLGN